MHTTTIDGGTFIPVTYIICGVVVTFENSLLLYVILPDYRFHSTSYIFIGSLGVTDLLIGIVSFVSGISRLPDHADPQLLAALMIVSIGVVFLSGAHMLAIAIERWLYVAHPFFYHRHVTEKTVRRTACTLWVLTLIYVVAALFCQTDGFGVWPDNVFHLHLYVKTIFIILMYALTMLLTFVFYLFILEVARKQRNKISAGHGDGSRQSAQASDLVKSVKYFATVFAIFVAMTIGPIIAIGVSIHAHLSESVRSIVFLLLYLNSGCNFGALFFFDRRFRTSCRGALGHLNVRHDAAEGFEGKPTETDAAEGFERENTVVTAAEGLERKPTEIMAAEGFEKETAMRAAGRFDKKNMESAVD